MDKELDALVKKIKLDNRKEYTNHFKAIFSHFIRNMKDDFLFQKLYSNDTLAGSYLDKLKITEPNEFDVNLLLKLPIRKEMISIRKFKKKPGYISINITQGINNLEKQPKSSKLLGALRTIIDNDCYICQDKVHSWMEHNVATVLGKLQKINNKYYINLGNIEYELSASKHGPAHTLDVYVKSQNIKFSVDLVIVFPFSSYHWMSERICTSKTGRFCWSAVPKSEKQYNGANRAWIASYVLMEQEIIKNKNNLKNTLRIMKYLRDKSNTNNLKSFFIKTIFMWEIEKQDVKFWNQSLRELTIHMLNVILDYLENYKIPSFWHKDLNLLGKLDNNQIKTMSSQLKQEGNRLFEVILEAKLKNNSCEIILEQY